MQRLIGAVASLAEQQVDKRKEEKVVIWPLNLCSTSFVANKQLVLLSLNSSVPGWLFVVR